MQAVKSSQMRSHRLSASHQYSLTWLYCTVTVLSPYVNKPYSENALFTVQWRRQDAVGRWSNHARRTSPTTEIAHKRSLEVVVSNASVRDAGRPAIRVGCLTGQRHHQFIQSSSSSSSSSRRVRHRVTVAPTRRSVIKRHVVHASIPVKSLPGGRWLLSWKSTKRIDPSRLSSQHERDRSFSRSVWLWRRQTKS